MQFYKFKRVSVWLYLCIDFIRGTYELSCQVFMTESIAVFETPLSAGDIEDYQLSMIKESI